LTVSCLSTENASTPVDLNTYVDHVRLVNKKLLRSGDFPIIKNGWADSEKDFLRSFITGIAVNQQGALHATHNLPNLLSRALCASGQRFLNESRRLPHRLGTDA